LTQAFYIGLMSGTSLDGIDAVLAGFEPERRLLATHWRAYPDHLKAALRDLHQPGPDELDRALRLANQLSDLYSESVAELLRQGGVRGETVRAIGCHGQTVRNQPARGYTLQLNNPARLVEQTGITVVADFRSRDIAAGGQGAPLLPAFHAAQFRHPRRHRAIVKVGGIANVTHLPAAGPLIGFDCGPGNLLMDAWVKRHWGGDYDPGGGFAAQGRVLHRLLETLLDHPFFRRPLPKSAGREDFTMDWLDRQLHGPELPEDVLSTLLEFTLRGIVNAINRHCRGVQEVWVCGGGAHNDELMRRLAAQLPEVRVGSTDELGISPDWVNALAIAWLARQAVEGRAASLPEATGARGARILGAIYPA
jgi:anhydro-N-acetylmuramic acid kinase